MIWKSLERKTNQDKRIENSVKSFKEGMELKKEVGQPQTPQDESEEFSETDEEIIPVT